MKRPGSRTLLKRKSVVGTTRCGMEPVSQSGVAIIGQNNWISVCCPTVYNLGQAIGKARVCSRGLQLLQAEEDLGDYSALIPAAGVNTGGPATEVDNMGMPIAVVVAIGGRSGHSSGCLPIEMRRFFRSCLMIL